MARARSPPEHGRPAESGISFDHVRQLLREGHLVTCESAIGSVVTGQLDDGGACCIRDVDDHLDDRIWVQAARRCEPTPSGTVDRQQPLAIADRHCELGRVQARLSRRDTTDLGTEIGEDTVDVVERGQIGLTAHMKKSEVLGVAISGTENPEQSLRLQEALDRGLGATWAKMSSPLRRMVAAPKASVPKIQKSPAKGALAKKPSPKKASKKRA